MQDYPLEERTIGRILAEKAARIPARTFLLWAGRSYSYGDLEALTNRYANGCAAHGIGHGDHVAVMLPNCPEFYWATWGLGKLGAVAVPPANCASSTTTAMLCQPTRSVRSGSCRCRPDR